MQDLKVTLVQTELAWEDARANLETMDRLVMDLQEPTDLIVLPEMFTTGFSMNTDGLAEDMDGPAVSWLKKVSRRKQADIAGSLIIRTERGYMNRLVWARPEGEILTYDKRHLFRMAGEEKVYTAGKDKVTIALNGWNVCPFICYDLRFPTWTRNKECNFDVAIFVANWPEKRSLHWKILLRARAIENQCYVVGVNRVGKDGNGIAYSGDSAVIDPKGKILFEKSHEPCIHTQHLGYTHLTSYRKAFPAWRDAGA